MKINAKLRDIRPYYAPQHDIDRSRVEAIIASVGDGPWTLPPVVVLDNEGNGYAPLDGHHRLDAAERLGLRTIPAWVVSTADYCRLVDAEFGGVCPPRLADLRDHVMCGDVTANDVAERQTA